MWTPRECVRMAHELYQGAGNEVLLVAESNLQASRATGDLFEIGFWTRVSRALWMIASSRALSRVISAVARPGDERRRCWALMQEIEAARHLAFQAEELAAMSDGAVREEAIDLAIGWRDLTAELEAAIGLPPTQELRRAVS